MLRVGQVRSLAQDPLDVLDFAAHDSGIEVVVRNLRILLQNAHRGMACHPVRGQPAHVMVRAGVFQETRDELRVRGGRFRRLGRPTFENLLQLFPIVLSILARKGVLDIAQHGSGGRFRMGVL